MYRLPCWSLCGMMVLLSGQSLAWIVGYTPVQHHDCRSFHGGDVSLPRRVTSSQEPRQSPRRTRRTRRDNALEQEEAEAKETSSSVSSSTSSSSSHPLSSAFSSTLHSHHSRNQFHEDMLRVLQSRRHNLDPYLRLARHRHRTPPFLPDYNNNNNNNNNYTSNDDQTRSDPDGAERVLTMLQRLMDMGAADETSVRIVMDAFRQRDRIRWYSYHNHDSSSTTRVVRRAADQVEELLQQLITIVPEQQISLETYNIALDAFANCASPRGDCSYAQRADGLLARLESLFAPEQLVHSRLLVLRAMAREQANLQGGSDCAERAQALLEEIRWHTQDAPTLMQAHYWVLEAWSKCATEHSVERAEACLAALQASRAELDPADTEYEEAQAWFNADVYSNTILAWSKSNRTEAAVRCRELLDDMLHSYQEGLFARGSEPTLIAFNAAIVAYCRSGRPDVAEEILWMVHDTVPLCSELSPSVISYNTILSAYLRNEKLSDAFVLEKMNALIETMEHKDDTHPSVRPNCFTYKTLLDAWLRHGGKDALMEAERLLMIIAKRWAKGDTSININNRIFNKVINAFAKSKNPQAADKALNILKQMKSSERYRPDIITYTSVLECLSWSRHPSANEAAESILRECFALYESTGNPQDRPNVLTFTMAITTFAKNQGSVSRAYELLEQVIQLYETTQDPGLRPNAFLYNNVLNCAAYSLPPTHAEAFTIAAKTYQGLRKSPYCQPDCFTYAFWLTCCSRLLPRGSDLQVKCVSYAMDECKQKGLVSVEVVKRLFQGNRPELVASLLQLSKDASRFRPQSGSILFSDVRMEDLPSSWSRNVSSR